MRTPLPYKPYRYDFARNFNATDKPKATPLSTPNL